MRVDRQITSKISEQKPVLWDCYSMKMKPNRNTDSGDSETSEDESSDSTLNVQKRRKVSKNSREVRFKCTYCEKSYNLNASLSCHMRVHFRKKLENSPVCCTKCKKTFKFKGSLINHMWICHSIKMKHTKSSDSDEDNKNSEDRPFKCTDCQKSFNYRGSLTNHKKVHVREKLENSKQKPISNSETSEDESSESTQLNHKEKSFPCTECEKSFVYQRTLINHMWNYHSIKIKMKRPTNHDSEATDDETSDPTLYARKPYPFKCTICKTQFQQHTRLITHMLKRHSIKMKQNLRKTENRFKCYKCNKVFPRKQQLRKHLFVHSERRPWICEVCKKGFKMKMTLKQHKKIHQPEKEFKCGVCGKAFNFKCNLTKHLTIHEKKG